MVRINSPLVLLDRIKLAWASYDHASCAFIAPVIYTKDELRDPDPLYLSPPELVYSQKHRSFEKDREYRYLLKRKFDVRRRVWEDHLTLTLPDCRDLLRRNSFAPRAEDWFIAISGPSCASICDKRLSMPLTLQVHANIRTGLVPGTGRPFHYNVRGLEKGISIANTGWRTGWQIYRWDGLGGRGSYKTGEEALAVLQREVGGAPDARL